MRVLFVTTGSQATVYAVAPLATAVRNAGHEVLLAVNEPLLEFTEAVGIPAVSVLPEPARHFVVGRSDRALRDGDRREETLAFGGGFARFAAAGLDALLDLTEAWSPDVVVGGSMSYAAGLLAARAGVPYVRHAEYLLVPGVPIPEVDPVAEEELRPVLTRLGLAGLPRPALFLDVCPPSLRPADAPEAQPMRWIPSNPQRRVEPWMYTRPAGRPRVLVTSGTHFRMLRGGALRLLVDRLAAAGAEVLVAASARAAEELGADLGDVRVGWMPLDVVAPTCDLAVTHAGATTAMTVLAAGVPQLIAPAPNPHTRAIARALSDFGAALTVPPEPGPDRDPAEVIAAGCLEVLSGPRYARQARALARENAALPAPSDVVRTLETLAAA